MADSVLDALETLTLAGGEDTPVSMELVVACRRLGVPREVADDQGRMVTVRHRSGPLREALLNIYPHTDTGLSSQQRALLVRVLTANLRAQQTCANARSTLVRIGAIGGLR